MIPINITGPMFSGKTTYLISLIDREIIAGKKTLIVRLDKDERHENSDTQIVSHNNYCYDKSEIKKVKLLDRVLYNYIILGNYTAIGIDEGQFFDNVDLFSYKLTEKNIKVFITSLNSDYLQRPFPQISRLNARSHVINLKAICLDCYKDDSIFTVRTSTSQDLIVIGGKSMYRSVCSTCVNKYNSNKDMALRTYDEFRSLCMYCLEYDFGAMTYMDIYEKNSEMNEKLLELKKKNKSNDKYSYFSHKIDELFFLLQTLVLTK